MSVGRPGRSRLALGIALLGLWVAPAQAIVGPSADGGALGPSMLMVLSRQGRLAGFCSGIVVAQDAILTAAHCAPPGADLKGHYREGGQPVLLDVAAVERSPGYRADAIRTRQRSIDLALVRLARPLPAAFRPAMLGEAAAAAPGAAFRLAGFGLRREGEPGSAGTLRVAGVAARAPLSAVLLWAEGAAGATGGACTGDSGGAVLDPAEDRVVAVIAWSAGAGGTQCGALTQAVWLAPQRDWIAAVLARWAAQR